MNLNYVSQAENLVKVRNVLLSVADKSGLEEFVAGLVRAVPEITFYSTGGTYAALEKILGKKNADRLKKVADYTGQPEMQGGLVKTLDFKIYLGLLSESFNKSHQQDLARTGGIQFDMTVVNLYPFRETIAKDNATLENARGNVDIGGPCMIRASAKNFLRVAPVCDPADYPAILKNIENQGGCTSMEQRFRLAKKAFNHTAEYDTAIAAYLEGFSDIGSLNLYTYKEKE